LRGGNLPRPGLQVLGEPDVDADSIGHGEHLPQPKAAGDLICRTNRRRKAPR
jgi:hypothetical protein